MRIYKKKDYPWLSLAKPNATSHNFCLVTHHPWVRWNLIAELHYILHACPMTRQMTPAFWHHKTSSCFTKVDKTLQSTAVSAWYHGIDTPFLPSLSRLKFRAYLPNKPENRYLSYSFTLKCLVTDSKHTRPLSDFNFNPNSAKQVGRRIWSSNLYKAQDSHLRWDKSLAWEHHAILQNMCKLC